MATSRTLRQLDAETLEIREGGGCVSLFGLPFFAAGAFLVLMAAGVIHVGNSEQVPGWGWPLIALMGLAFVAVGGSLVLGRKRVVLARDRGQVLQEWRLGVPLRRTAHPLAEYDAAIVRFESGDSDSAERYPVALRGRGGVAPLPLHSSPGYGDAWELGRCIAQFLRLPLVDATSEHETVTQADRLDETFRERLQRSDDVPEHAGRPPGTVLHVRESASEVQVVIPPQPFTRWKLLVVLVPLGALALIGPSLLEFFHRTRTPVFVQAAFLGFLTLVLAVLPLAKLLNALRASRRAETRITANASGISIEVRGAWRSRLIRLPAEEIFGLDYGTRWGAIRAASETAEQRAALAGRKGGAALPAWLAALARLAPSKGVTIKSKLGLVPVGAGLANDDVRYLHAVLTRALAGHRPARW